MIASTQKRFARFLAAGCVAVMVLGSGPTCFGSGHKAEKKSSHGESRHAEKKSESGHGEEGGHGSEEPGVKSNGVELGQFKIRSDYPAEAQKSTVRFILHAAIKPELRDKMEELAKHHQTKIRDEILITTRLTPLSLFEEPDLASFRRRIMVRLRRTLPEFEIEGLYISDFGLVVKSL
jgi:hypothetical protein